MRPCALTMLLIFAASCLDAGEYFIRGERFANWWTIDETVSFKLSEGCFPKGSPKGSTKGTVIDRRPSSPLPDGTKSVVGKVFDSSGSQIDEKAVPASTFISSGWQWKAPKPGFYSVKFVAMPQAGEGLVLSETITAKPGWAPSPDDPKFQHEMRSFAVLPGKPRAPAQVPAQLGVSFEPPWSLSEWDACLFEDSMREASLLGFRYVRALAEWDRFEKEEGKFTWECLDHLIKSAKEKGIDKFALGFYGTPKWASPHPEKEKINICVREYASYAPVDISKYTNFIQAAMKRYPGVREWEIWNEPSMPGMSCYWSDTPERYVELLKASYKTIKGRQPDAIVWTSGSYLAFYERIFKLGAGQYFDRLARHGKAKVSPSAFHKIEEESGIAPKPWLNGEFHAALAGSGANDLNQMPSEDEIAHNMILSFARNMQLGAESMAFFTMSNHYGSEMEMVDFYRKSKLFFQVCGVFRRTPCPEPRIQAVAWRNFSDCFSGDIKVLGSYATKDSMQSAALMGSDSGKVLFIWNSYPRKALLSKELQGAIGPKSALFDWEGFQLNPKELSLLPFKVYFLKNPDERALSSLVKTQMVEPAKLKGKVELLHQSKGSYREGPLFDGNFKVLAPEGMAWMPLDKHVAMGNAKRDESFSARFAAGFSEGGLELLVEVSDAEHVQKSAGDKLWEGDSVQFAIDAQGNGDVEDRLEISAALTHSGSVMVKEHMPVIGGDLPSRISLEGQRLKYAKADFKRESGKTVYKIRILQEELFPFQHLREQPLRFSILVNDNDGSGRAGYLQWASGIGEGKYPAKYGDLSAKATRP